MKTLKNTILFLICFSTSYSIAAPLRISQPSKESGGCDLYVANFDSLEEFKVFFSKLKQLSTEKNIVELSKMILYPLRVKLNGKHVMINDAADFTKEFSRVWTTHVSDSLANQEEATLFCNYQGVMIGNGQIWIKKLNVNHKVVVGSINP